MEQKQQPTVLIVRNPDTKKYLDDKRNDKTLGTPQEVKYITIFDLEKYGNNILKQEDVCLTLNPITHQYELFKNQEKDVVEKRMFAIMTIVSLLGGFDFKYSLESKEDVKNQSVNHIKVDIDIPATSLNMTADDNQQEQRGEKKSTTLTAQWTGRYTKESYRQAVIVAKTYGLDEDAQIKALLQQRHPEHPNQIQSQIYDVTLNSEFQERSELITRCNTTFQTINIGGEYQSMTEKYKTQERKMYFAVSFHGDCLDDAYKNEPELTTPQKHSVLNAFDNITTHSADCLTDSKSNSKAYANDVNSTTNIRTERLGGLAHEHINFDVLSNITADKVENWDNAELNAKTYADDLNSATIVRIEGLEAQAHEHPNEDALSEISIGSIALWNTSPKIIAECDARLNIEKIRINNLEKKSHEHKNNEILEHINEDNIKSWNAAESNAKRYTESVSSRAEQSAKDHANQLNNQTAQAINSLKEQLQQQKHSNREVLDGISTERVKKWDNSEQNAINHSDEIKQKLTKRIDDLNWILTEKMNAQESLLQQTIERHIAYETKLKKILIALGCVAIVGFLLSVLLIFDV